MRTVLTSVLLYSRLTIRARTRVETQLKNLEAETEKKKIEVIRDIHYATYCNAHGPQIVGLQQAAVQQVSH